MARKEWRRKKLQGVFAPPCHFLRKKRKNSASGGLNTHIHRASLFSDLIKARGHPTSITNGCRVNCLSVSPQFYSAEHVKIHCFAAVAATKTIITAPRTAVSAKLREIYAKNSKKNPSFNLKIARVLQPVVIPVLLANGQNSMNGTASATDASAQGQGWGHQESKPHSVRRPV